MMLMHDMIDALLVCSGMRNRFEMQGQPGGFVILAAWVDYSQTDHQMLVSTNSG